MQASARAVKPARPTADQGPVDFRTLTCAALAFALAGAAVSFEIVMTDYWVPMSLGIIAIVFAVGAILAAIEDAESQILPALAILIAAFAVIQGFGAMNDLKDAKGQVEDLQNQLQQISPEDLQQQLPGLTQ